MSMNLSPMNDSQAGFTLVEILVTITVCGIILASMSLSLINQTHISQENRDLVLANAYVEGKVEALRSAGFKSLANGTTDISSELPSELGSPRSATLTISSLDVSTEKIDISVTYNDQ